MMKSQRKKNLDELTDYARDYMQKGNGRLMPITVLNACERYMIVQWGFAKSTRLSYIEALKVILEQELKQLERSSAI